MNECVNLQGAHPYYAGLGPVSLSVPFWAELPGREVTYLADVPKAVRQSPDSWTLLAGPFVMLGEAASAVRDRRLLLGLVWDLAGEPLHPALPRRTPARWLLVWQDRGTAMVYRATAEMLTAVDEAEEGIREVVPVRLAPRRRLCA